MKAWNDLPVHIRNADSKETLATDKKNPLEIPIRKFTEIIAFFHTCFPK